MYRPVLIASLLLSLINSSALTADYYFRLGGSFETAPGGPPGTTPGNEDDVPSDTPVFTALPSPTVPGSVGEAALAPIGNYEGRPDGWSCPRIAGQEWIECEFMDGVVQIIGTPPTASVADVTVTVVNDDYSQPVEVSLDIVPVPKFTAETMGSDIYAVAGEAIDVPIGTFKGNPFGWSCKGSNSTLKPWLGCVAENGRIHLKGTAPAERQTVNNGLEILKNGTFRGEVGYRNPLITVDLQDYRDTATPSSPRPGIFTAMPGVARYATAGKPVDILLGTHTGDGEGWLCTSSNSALRSWMRCEAEDGNIYLRGTPTGTRDSISNGIRVVKDGVIRGEIGYQNPFLLVDVQDYHYFDATPDSPRPGKFTKLARNVNYVTAGKTTDILLGTYTGDDAGWTCTGDTYSMRSWMGCIAEAGKIHMRFSPPAGTRDVIFNGYAVVKDGIVVGGTNYESVQTVVDAQDYVPADATTKAPRAGSFSAVDDMDRYAVAGTDVDVLLGTYGGDDDGWLCTGTDFRMAPWMRCEADDGEIRLRGRAPAGFEKTNNGFYIVKDGAIIARTAYKDFFVGVQTYATATPGTPENPRKDASLKVVKKGDVEIAGGSQFDVLLATFEGDDDGWLCAGGHYAMETWQSCVVSNGEIRLIGSTPPGWGMYGNSFLMVKDGLVQGKTQYELFRTF
jgi:hypothetical protein